MNRAYFVVLAYMASSLTGVGCYTNKVIIVVESSDAGSVDSADDGADDADGGESRDADSGQTKADGSDAGPDHADGDAAASGDIYCEPSNGACTCVVETHAAGPAPTCPPSTMPDPVCCAGPGYPQNAISTCACSNWVCNETPSLCLCEIDQTGTAAGSACGSSHPYCCENVLSDGTVNGCSCGSFPCQNGDVPVASCSTSRIGCVGGQRKVPACAP